MNVNYKNSLTTASNNGVKKPVKPPSFNNGGSVFSSHAVDTFSKAQQEQIYGNSSILDAMCQDYYLRNKVVGLMDSSAPRLKECNMSKPKTNFDLSSIERMNIQRLHPTSDGQGVRGSSIFLKANKKHLPELKDCGIERVIDLRGEAKANACREFCKDNGLEYFNFPVAYNDAASKEVKDKLPEFIEFMKKGKYYIGCNEGSNRTDVGVGLKYIFDKDAKDIPVFRSGRSNHSTQMLRKAVNEIVGKEKNGTINEEIVKKLGWNNYAAFKKDFVRKMENIAKTNI